MHPHLHRKMPEMYRIIPITEKAADERGSTHYFHTDRTGEFIIAYRKAGSKNGRHYHKGTAPSKNPEQIIIMQGTATLTCYDVRDQREATVQVQAPVLIEIEPWIWHQVVADTDIIVFELNGLEDAKDDTFRLDDR